MLTVDPEKSHDAFYRYKMAPVKTKIESGGNGIYTVIPNISEICDRIDRTEEYLMTFFAHELGTKNIRKNDKCFVMGERTQDTMQGLVYDFIKKFVLCKQCRNPETSFVVDSDRNITLSCRACSRSSAVDPRQKLCNLILKNEKPVDGGTVTGGKTKGKRAKGTKKKSKDEEQEAEFDKALRQAGEGDVVTSAVEELPNPVEVMKNLMKQDPPPDRQTIIEKAYDIKHNYGFKERQVVALMFNVLFDENIATQIDKGAPIIKRFTNDDNEIELIIQMEFLCAEDAALQKKFAIFLKKFYDAEVLQEATILKWYNGKPSKKVPSEASALYRAKAKPLVEWLEADDSDEESDSDEEEEEQVSPTKATGAATNGTGAAADAAGDEAEEEEEEEEIDLDAI